jgi:hypothetical protein
VKECKTIGIPDPLMGESVQIACTLKRPGEITEEELSKWLKPRLSAYKRPDRISIFGYLPKTSTGKISIHQIRKILTGTLTSEIIDSLTSCRRKRSQPYDIESIQEHIQAALISGEPIRFLTYWGCGPRDSMIAEDRAAVDRLVELIRDARRIPEVPVTLTFLFTDVHGQNNAIPEERRTSYFRQVRDYAESQGILTETLSACWKHSGFSFSDLKSASLEPGFLDMWAKLPIREKLIEQAAKHFEASRDYDSAARQYYRACLWDDVAVTKLYPGHIFLTYNPPEMDALLPRLPKLYLFSFKEGTSMKPWFVEVSEMGAPRKRAAA